MIKIINVVLIITVFLISGLFYNVQGEKILKETELIADAVAGGQAEAVTGKSGLYYFLYNPASVSKINSTMFVLNHYEWIFDTKVDNIKFAVPLILNELSLAGEVTGNYFLDLKEYTETSIRELNYHCLIGNLGVGGKIKEFNNNRVSLNTGINIKIIDYSIINEKFNAALIDIGFLIDTKLLALNDFGSYNDKNFSIGFSVQNLRLDKDYNSMPLIMRAGINYKFFKCLNVSVDYVLKDKSYINTGLEYSLKNIIYFRVGYGFFYDIIWITGGIGIKYRFANSYIRVDYSISPVKELGISHKIGFTWAFTGRKSNIKRVKGRKILYYKGIYYFTNDKYKKAISIWKKIPASDILYVSAQKRINEAKKFLKEEKMLKQKLGRIEKLFQKMDEEK